MMVVGREGRAVAKGPDRAAEVKRDRPDHIYSLDISEVYNLTELHPIFSLFLNDMILV